MQQKDDSPVQATGMQAALLHIRQGERAHNLLHHGESNAATHRTYKRKRRNMFSYSHSERVLHPFSRFEREENHKANGNASDEWLCCVIAEGE